MRANQKNKRRDSAGSVSCLNLPRRVADGSFQVTPISIPFRLRIAKRNGAVFPVPRVTNGDQACKGCFVLCTITEGTDQILRHIEANFGSAHISSVKNRDTTGPTLVVWLPYARRKDGPNFNFVSAQACCDHSGILACGVAKSSHRLFT